MVDGAGGGLSLLLLTGFDGVDNFDHPVQVELQGVLVGLVGLLQDVHLGKVG